MSSQTKTWLSLIFEVLIPLCLIVIAPIGRNRLISHFPELDVGYVSLWMQATQALCLVIYIRGLFSNLRIYYD